MQPPEWLHSPKDVPPSAPLIGVMVGVSSAPHLQLHVGLLHADEDRPPRVLHLAWHVTTLNEPLPDNAIVPFWWVELALPAPKAEEIAGLCRRIADRVEVGLEIPYGLLYEGGRFRDDGTTLFAGREIGFTCSTFVLAVLESAGLTLVHRESWEERPDDARWRASTIAFMRMSGVPPKHIAGVEREPTWPRYKPEEIAAACNCAPLPVSFGDVLAGAREIVRSLLPKAPGTA